MQSRTFWRTATLLILLAVCLPIVAVDVDIDRILADYVRALGGVEAINAIETRMYTGHVVHDIHWETPPYDVRDVIVFAQKPGEMAIKEYDHETTIDEACSERNGWGIYNRDNTGTSGGFDEKLFIILQPHFALDITYLLGPLEYNGIVVVRDHRCHMLTPVKSSAEQSALYFEENTGLLLRVGYHFDILDYYETDGVMTPTRIVENRKGGSVTYFFRDVQNNIEIDEAIFAISPTE